MNHSRWIRIFSWCIVLTLMIMPLSNQPLAAAEEAIGHNQPASSPSSTPTDQIIIKYTVMSLQSGGYAPAGAAHMAQLSAKAGIELQYVRPMSDEVHVVRLPGRRPESEVQQYADRLMQLAEVEYAEPDRIMRPALTPNDPQYNSQWHYFGPYGINAPAAWDITTGSYDVVVGVIDTGYRPHADLAGRFLPGYDFIADVPTANDGNGRDADARDPGDWITTAERNAVGGPFEGCRVDDSSWHGTHVAGTIGANSNNGVGVTGINWVSSIVPVRVLGKCGGYTSDIIDGMRWAAGLSVTGVPANPNPAKVLNLSLGGYSPAGCGTPMQNAVNAIVAAGTTVVVAAGNESDSALYYSPGNCNNVITVAATDKYGDKAWYSNDGSTVEISGPGGDTYFSSEGVLSTLNSGTTVPAADIYGYFQGTSMATPHVVGVVSLLYSLVPTLTPTQVRQILQNTVTAFPGGSTCNTSICGSGIVNAANAVAVLPRITSLSPASKLYNTGGFTLTVTGANFTAGSVINWNGSARTTVFVSSTQLRATIPASDVNHVTAGVVTVTTPHPTYGSLTARARSFLVFGPFNVDLPLVRR
ncbi:serine protease [Thermoflexales bacterium]|nr:serine protease [Thermoflexales bacterium]